MLRFIHITDSHIGPDPSFVLYETNPLEQLNTLVQHLNQLPFKIDFVLHTGDVTNDYQDDSMRLAAEALAPIAVPVHYAAGNHDGRAAMREFLFKQPRGSERIFYDFAYDEFHFLVLDTQGDPDPQGYLGEDQLDWLQEKCASSDARSLVLVLHHLPLVTDVPWLNHNMRIMNDRALFDALRPHRDRLRGVFFGHIHRAFSGFREGILCSAAPSTFRQFDLYPGDETPRFNFKAPGGFSMITMTHDQTVVTYYDMPGAPS